MKPVTDGVKWLDSAGAECDEAAGLCWYDIRALRVEGQGWRAAELAAAYDRLPKKAEGRVPDPVWNLSHHAAGLCARFVTDATEIRARWSLTGAGLGMPHMAPTGVSGLDLYVRDDAGIWRWLGVGKPESKDSNESVLVSGIPAGEREYILYLPLYNGVTAVTLGLPKANRVAPGPARSAGRDKPILFYGTSITQGGCASRPGMVHTAILGRRFDMPVINLGFSGNGKMEIELAELLAELDPAVYVLDCLPNMMANEVSERVVPFVKKLRASRPDTPILLVEDRTYGQAILVTESRRRNDDSRVALRAAHEQLLKDGGEGLAYLEGEHLLGEDNEGTVDSSHPTDLGFWRQAAAFETALKPLLGGT